MNDAPHHQQKSYNHHVQQISFQMGDAVWLDLPTAGKLEPKWVEGWIENATQGPIIYLITDGKTGGIMHINRL